MPEERTDYDSPWKLALTRFWQPFLSLCFPSVAAGIDWSRPVEFLDKELQAVVRDGEAGRRHADALAQVFRDDGSEQWVLVHVEVQNRPDPGFAARMYQYHQRLTDRYSRSVASLAVLADSSPDWRPREWESELWGCRVRFEFLVCKLLDIADAQLEVEPNPVSFVIAAHLAAQRYRRRPMVLKRAKFILLRRLYSGGYQRQDVLDLIWLVDWLIRLPPPLEAELHQELVENNNEKIMPYITSFERLGKQKGLQEGRLEGRLEIAREAVLDVLVARFGPVPDELVSAVQGESDLERLRQWHRSAVTCPTLQAMVEVLMPPAV